jgi:Protein of unknown function DUF104
MLQLAADLRFLDEPIYHIGIVSVRLEHDLDGQFTAQVHVAALEDRSHPAPRNLALPGPVEVSPGGPPGRLARFLSLLVWRHTRSRLVVARGMILAVSGFRSGATAMTLTIEAIYENGVLKPGQSPRALPWAVL